MAILAFLALTTIAAFVAYLAGYGAGRRKEFREIASSGRAFAMEGNGPHISEDDRVQPVDPYLLRQSEDLLDESLLAAAIERRGDRPFSSYRSLEDLMKELGS